jgi:phage terminase large subunit-like protein
MTWLVLINMAAAWCMTGLIWFVQVVHYPLLAVVPPEAAREVAVQHQQRTGWVVAIPMAVEGASTLVLMFHRPAAISWQWAWAGGVCVAVWLVSTVALSVPRHQRMLTDPSPELGRALVRTNWPRTIAWTGHAAILTVMVWRLV